ncbi:dynactin subunit 1-like [Oppia nitens]|uniref:dynactin subunit 1-like n=1 Tax=Oppia nitens TaxID=1686743 RepID=UPI0023D9A9A2|nr:dynactin subunit 1-like [Oppia nitens]
MTSRQQQQHVARLEVGQRVEYLTGGKRVLGRLAYGPAGFHVKPNETDWCGVVLDDAVGKNNGTFQGVEYFKCRDGHGIFVRANCLRPIHDSRIPGSNRSTPATTPKTMTPSTSQLSLASQSMDRSMSASVTMAAAESAKTTPEKEGKDVKHMIDDFKSKISAKITESNDQHLVHKRPDNVTSAQVSGSLSADVSAHVRESIEALKDKLNDLQTKYDTLLARRAQDKEKLRDYEKLRLQCEQLQENKRQMSEKIAEMTKAKSAAEKEAKEAREEQLRHADEMKDLVETAEIAVIDKEMAENKSEQLQSELEQTKERLEEVTLDLEIIKSEIEEKGTDGAVSSYQTKQLEQQNERLKEALLKLRDISAQDKSELQTQQKDLDKCQTECTELQKLNDQLTQDVQQYEEQIVDLKEQIDSALGSQEMVEKLTETNLKLEDKLNEMQEALDDEENIRDLNNQLIEAKEEQVMELREELDMSQSKINIIKNEYSILQETLADYESTIKKFRDLVTQLRQENQELAAKSDSAQTQQISQKVENFEFHRVISDRKAFTRAIDMELRRLEVDQCQKHIGFLSKFLPEVFFSRGGDHESIQVLLFLPRIVRKCEIIERQMIEKYQSLAVQEITKQTIVESHDSLRQQVFIKQLLYNLLSIQSVLTKFIESLHCCDCELFLHIGGLFPELRFHEKTIDHFMDLLKEDKLDETQAVEPLEKTLQYFQSVYSIHLADKRVVDHNKLVNDFITIIKSASDAIHLDLTIISAICGDGCETLLKTLSTHIEDIDQFYKKITRRLKLETPLTLDESIENEISDCMSLMGRLIQALKVVRVKVMQTNDPCDGKHLDELAKEVGGLKFINDSLQSVMTICCQFSTALQQGDYDETKSLDTNRDKANPIDERAHIWKTQTEEIDGLKSRMESRESETNELKRALKLKMEELSEMQIRRDLAEKKLSNATKEADERVVRLQNELDLKNKEFKDKEIEMERTLNKYNHEINDLYSNQRIMKEKLKDYSKSDLIGKIMTSKTSTNESVLITQIRDLRTALKKVMDDNYSLQIKIAERDVKLRPLATKSYDNCKPLWLLRAQGREQDIDPKQERLIQLTKQVNQLQSDIRLSMITNSVWDFKRPLPKQRREQELKRLDLISRYDKLERDINDFVQTFGDGYQTGAHFTSFPAPHISKCFNERTAKLAAILSVPSTKSAVVSLEVTYEQLKGLHRKLL